MKKCSIITLCLLFSLLLTTSGAAAGEQTPATEANTAQTMLQAYQRVLEGTESYFQYNPDVNMLCDPGENMNTEAYMTDEITIWYDYMFGQPLHREAFAVTDLDADGAPELLLKLSNDFGFELLRAYDGNVYGYPFVARGMEAVTVDGDIHGSSGAGNFGWYRLSFTQAQLEPILLCWRDDTADPNEQYIIDNAIASEAEFTQRNETLWAKPLVAFTALTNAAIADDQP